jgi:hypothetical protein
MTIEEWREFCLGKLIYFLDASATEPNPRQVGRCTAVEWCCVASDVRIEYVDKRGQACVDLADADNDGRSFSRVVVWGE